MEDQPTVYPLPHESKITPGAENAQASSRRSAEEVGAYLVPVDPMDDLGCDSCQ